MRIVLFVSIFNLQGLKLSIQKHCMIINNMRYFLRFFCFFSGILSKSKGHVHRIAMCLQALKNSQMVLLDTKENKKGPLTPDFKKKIGKRIQNLDKEEAEYEVDLDTSKKAIKLTNHFMEHKKILAGYEKTHNFTRASTANPVMRKIILEQGQTVLTKTINKRYSIPAEKIKNAMILLSAKSLGQSTDYIGHPSGKGGKTSHKFIKQDYEELNGEARQEFNQELSQLEITPEQYKKSFCEIPENNSDRKKRDFGEDSNTLLKKRAGKREHRSGKAHDPVTPPLPRRARAGKGPHPHI